MGMIYSRDLEASYLKPCLLAKLIPEENSIFHHGPQVSNCMLTTVGQVVLFLVLILVGSRKM